MPAPDVPPRHSPLGRAITGLTVVVVGLGTMVGFFPAPSRRAQMTVLLVMAGLVVASLWLRRRDQRAYERRLAQETAARAVAEDRLVIARELHDAVSGNLGAITVRCAVAQRLETDTDGLRHALRDIEETSREATDELRRMLGVLREDSGPSTPSVPSMPEDPETRTGGWVLRADGDGGGSGAVGVGGVGGGAGADLEHALAGAVGRARRAGVTVEVEAVVEVGDGSRGVRGIRGAREAAGAQPSEAVEAVARVVDEALANTARHAGPTRARVVVRQEPSRLHIAVVDDGPVPGWEPRPGAGQGLRGLRERVEAVGGTLRAETGAARTAGPPGTLGITGTAETVGAPGAVDAPRAGFSVEVVVPLPSSMPLVSAQSDRAEGTGGRPAEGAAVSTGASSSPSPEYADAGSRHG